MGFELPCRDCQAPTYMEVGGYRTATRILNPDGTLHECHEAEKAQAIGIIFWGQIEDACDPCAPKDLGDRLQSLLEDGKAWGADSDDLQAIAAATAILKLIVSKSPPLRF